jgi:NAD(P)-dependent dehydrogenase (short-subunit alcohol dehydrogenase family)
MKRLDSAARAAAEPAPGAPGDTVLVTGSSTGLGLETAIGLAAKGFTVYATVRDLGMKDDVLAAAAERGVELRVLRLDLTDQASIDAAVEQIIAETGGIFALINNGGVGLRGCLEDLSDADVRAVFEANVFGTIAITKAVLPSMRAAGRGRVVTIGSVGGRVSSFGVSVYCSSKFAQEGLAEALYLELAPFGLHSILIEPGIIKTTRWSTNRATSEGARNPSSAYRPLFEAGEVLADRVVNRSRTTAADVADSVAESLTATKPKLRYVVGQPAGLVILLRRYLPNRAFERVYFGGLLRQLTTEAKNHPAPVSPVPVQVVLTDTTALPESASATSGSSGH